MNLLMCLQVLASALYAPHEQAVIRVLGNLSQVVLEMTRAMLVVHASVSKV